MSASRVRRLAARRRKRAWTRSSRQLDEIEAWDLVLAGGCIAPNHGQDIGPLESCGDFFDGVGDFARLPGQRDARLRGASRLHQSLGERPRHWREESTLTARAGPPLPHRKCRMHSRLDVTGWYDAARRGSRWENVMRVGLGIEDLIVEAIGAKTKGW